ncbi:MAG: 4-alpha-glucanotransferase [Clostridia bacterium]|nr:4-alpha-glucanotransferase [Clostridia bacterium]
MRQSGILLHISSLPGPDGIGSLGKEAFDFADFLHRAGMTIWQVLPMGPTGYGESPYQSTSVYAGNTMLISIDRLIDDGLCPKLDDGERYVSQSPDSVDFPAVRRTKTALLRKSFQYSEAKLSNELSAFKKEQSWVTDFALFTALKDHFGGVKWTDWPDKAVKSRDEDTLSQFRAQLDEEIRFHIWCQYVFARQWRELKSYCNGLGISLFGDMPIYCAEDSADSWLHPEVFQLSQDGEPRRVAGVPPDYFSEDGQLWGNPLYRWTWLKENHYGWWVERMRHMGEMYDIIRVDHFIGFANYYSIPHGAPNARNGRWIVGPGKSLFKTLKQELPDLNIVAEDLGEVNDRVRSLIAWTGYPGMRVLQFAFTEGEGNTHLPELISENTAYYTGTHDNVTALSWIKSATDEQFELARTMCDFVDEYDAPWSFIRTVFMSKARIAVTPAQDILALDDWATMNRPGTVGGGNWAWRIRADALTDELANKLLELNRESGRG